MTATKSAGHPLPANETAFVAALSARVAHGILTPAQVDRELVERYKSSDTETRQQLREAVNKNLVMAERIAQNLSAFGQVDSQQ